MYKTAMTLKLSTITNIKGFKTLVYEKSTLERKETSKAFVVLPNGEEVGYSGLVRLVNSKKETGELPSESWFNTTSGRVQNLGEQEAPRLGFKEEPKPKVKKKELKPVPFSKKALASIQEALDSGGFKNWADFKSLKGIGPVTSKIMEDLGWNEPVFFFYKEHPVTGEVTRKSAFFTLEEMKKKHPSGANWKERNKSFCAGSMVECKHPGANKKNNFFKPSNFKASKKVSKSRGVEIELPHADLGGTYASEVMLPENRIYTTNRRKVKTLKGWKARNPKMVPGKPIVTKHGTFFRGACCLLVPEGYDPMLMKSIVRSKVDCKLADLAGGGRPKDKEETCETMFWFIAPRNMQDHKVKVRKEASGLIDVDRDVENIVTSAMQDEKTRAAREEEKERKEANKKLQEEKKELQDMKEKLESTISESKNKSEVAAAMLQLNEVTSKLNTLKKKKTMRSPEEFRQFQEDVFVEVNFGAGKVVKKLKKEISKLQSVVTEQYNAMAEKKDLPLTKEELKEMIMETLPKKAKQYEEAVESVPQLGYMLWYYENKIEGTPTEQYLRDKFQAEDVSGSFFSADQKSFATLNENTERSDVRFMDVFRGRDDSSWEFGQMEEMEVHARWVAALEYNLIPAGHKLGYSEKSAHMVDFKQLLRHGRPGFTSRIAIHKEVQVWMPVTTINEVVVKGLRPLAEPVNPIYVLARDEEGKPVAYREGARTHLDEDYHEGIVVKGKEGLPKQGEILERDRRQPCVPRPWNLVRPRIKAGVGEGYWTTRRVRAMQDVVVEPIKAAETKEEFDKRLLEHIRLRG